MSTEGIWIIIWVTLFFVVALISLGIFMWKIESKLVKILMSIGMVSVLLIFALFIMDEILGFSIKNIALFSQVKLARVIVALFAFNICLPMGFLVDVYKLKSPKADKEEIDNIGM